MKKHKYLVSVRCFTYNHAPYIKDALNGFCMQETTFPFVCTIVDDASTDGEQKVIKKYMDEHFDLNDDSVVRNEETDDYYLTFTQHKTNKNCYFAVLFLKYNHYSIKKPKKSYLTEWVEGSKYTAVCEGDDYWIDPKKLQKQIDFMESHPNHSLCIHAYRREEFKGDDVLSVDIHKYSNNIDIIPDKDVVCNMGLLAATASMVYREAAVVEYPEWTNKAPVGDRPLQLVLFARGHISYINEVMSVYRIGVPGSWTNRVLTSHKKNKKLTNDFRSMMDDFDDWSNRRYHSLVKKAKKKYLRLFFKKELLYFKNRINSCLKQCNNP